MAATTTLTESQSPLQDLKQYGFSNLRPYVHPPETKADLPWSELVTLDLEDYHRPGGKERLAKQLEHAVHHVGFFYVKNFGLTPEQVDQQFTIAQALFELPIEEKEPYEVNYEAADYNGWRRPFRTKTGKTTAFSNIEMYNSEFISFMSLPSPCLQVWIFEEDRRLCNYYQRLRSSKVYISLVKVTVFYVLSEI